MVTAVGLTARATCAAIRCAIDGYRRTGYVLDGDWLRAGQILLPSNARKENRWLDLARWAVEESVAEYDELLLTDVPVLLCLPEPSRPGRPAGLRADLLRELRKVLGLDDDPNPERNVFETGRVAVADALARFSELREHGHRTAVIVGVDSLLTPGCLHAFRERRRLLTPRAQDGFLPGEAAAAVVVTSRRDVRGLDLLGLGRAVEPAPVESGNPLRGTGLADAFREALARSRADFDAVHYRLCDANGEQYAFKEGALALARSMRALKSTFDVWHPADCVGEVGAAVGPLLLGVALTAARKGYAPGPGVLCHLGSDAGARAAMVLAATPQRRS